MTDSFAHLHCHSEFSLLDGAAKLTPLFAEASRLGMPALAITDHGNMFGAAEAYRASLNSPVKWIAGIEAYIAPTSRHHKQPVFWGHSGQRKSDEYGEGGDVSGAGAYTHMTMLAEDATGLRNLFRLSSEASFTGFFRKPRMDKELIAQHAEGIIATTGCPSGEVQTRLRLGQYAEALKSAADYRDIFGPGNFYLELMDHGLAVERSVREDLLRIGRELGAPPLATNDSHYVTRDQAGAHDALLCVQVGKTISDPNRFRFDGDGYYLKAAQEMRGYWDGEVPGACDTTLAIAQRVESYAEVFANVDRKPRVPLEPGDTEDAALRREVDTGVSQRFPDGLPLGYRERVEMELRVIAGQRFGGYFLVVVDLTRWAAGQGIFCRARGSACGSLVLYLMGATDIDPMVHGLFFERFLNPDRVSPPDVDIDADERRRGECIAYLSDRWGSENVAQVITFGRIKTKAAIKDATRVLGYPVSAGESLRKALPPQIHAEDVPLSAITDPAHERYAECAAIRTMVESDTRAEEIVATARGLEGLIRNAGVHACGVVLSSEPLVDVLPMWARPADGAFITGWDGWTIESAGLVKFDVLSSDTNAVIMDTLAAVKANHGVKMSLTDLPLDDPATYDLLGSGHALGVFQMESAGMRDLLRRIRPTMFPDICAATALYRPGPMGTNTHNEYADRKNGLSPVIPIHPELAEPLSDVLSDTYSLAVYQEDVMAISRKVAGYSLGQADLLRRAMGKKKKEVLDGEYIRFRDGMAANGYSTEAMKTLWDLMVPFSAYGFVKSHAASYGLVSYWTACLKAHYPAEFMAARLSSVSDNKLRTAIYLAECRRMGLSILPPDVNESALHFTATPAGIRFGLGAIRNVGHGVVTEIVRARESPGRFTSFPDFLSKCDTACCNKQMLASLIKSGAFDSLGHSRLGLFNAHEAAVDAALGKKRQDAQGQFDLFGGDVPLSVVPIGAQEWPQRERLAFEREQLGCYVSAHPLDGAVRALRRRAPRSVGECLADPPAEGEKITVAGLVTSIDLKTVKSNGKRWAVVTMEDVDGECEVRLLSRAYEVYGPALAVDTVVAVTGQVSDGEGVLRILADGVTVLDLADAEAEPMVVSMTMADCTRERVLMLRELITQHRGDREVRLSLATPGGSYLLAIDNSLRVASAPALVVQLRSLLGPDCVVAS